MMTKHITLEGDVSRLGGVDNEEVIAQFMIAGDILRRVLKDYDYKFEYYVVMEDE
jgi:hypothetical protein